mmetsp:Transcript_35815/g.40262  ORF Transcript_35815/g.40262 Transcript_35815/m.40262 type:complete len:179 (+) Transcript_35815:2-538(+)
MKVQLSLNNFSALTTVCMDIPNNIIIDDLSTSKNFDTVIGLLNEETVNYVWGMLSENPSDDNTREAVRGILMEVLSSQDEVVVDGAGMCDSLLNYSTTLINTNNNSLILPLPILLRSQFHQQPRFYQTPKRRTHNQQIDRYQSSRKITQTRRRKSRRKRSPHRNREKQLHRHVPLSPT